MEYFITLMVKRQCWRIKNRIAEKRAKALRWHVRFDRISPSGPKEKEMAAIYEYTGVVEKVMPTQTIGAKGFQKRDLIVTDDEGTASNYPNHIPFTFKQDRVNLLDSLKKGQRVKVRFAIDGRVWHSPKTDEDVYFKDLVGLKIDVLGAEGDAAAEPIPESVSEADIPVDLAGDVEDLPF
jgi:hypothetical protein